MADKPQAIVPNSDIQLAVQDTADRNDEKIIDNWDLLVKD